MTPWRYNSNLISITFWLNYMRNYSARAVLQNRFSAPVIKIETWQIHVKVFIFRKFLRKYFSTALNHSLKNTYFWRTPFDSCFYLSKAFSCGGQLLPFKLLLLSSLWLLLSFVTSLFVPRDYFASCSYATQKSWMNLYGRFNFV